MMSCISPKSNSIDKIGYDTYEIMTLMIKITMQVSQPCGIENGRRHQSRWLNSKAMEALHTPTSRGSQNPNQNLPTMDLKRILGHNNWDPNQLGGPPSSNHGPPSWAPLENPSWLHSSLCKPSFESPSSSPIDQ